MGFAIETASWESLMNWCHGSHVAQMLKWRWRHPCSSRVQFWPTSLNTKYTWFRQNIFLNILHLSEHSETLKIFIFASCRRNGRQFLCAPFFKSTQGMREQVTCRNKYFTHGRHFQLNRSTKWHVKCLPFLPEKWKLFNVSHTTLERNRPHLEIWPRLDLFHKLLPNEPRSNHGSRVKGLFKVWTLFFYIWVALWYKITWMLFRYKIS